MKTLEKPRGCLHATNHWTRWGAILTHIFLIILSSNMLLKTQWPACTTSCRTSLKTGQTGLKTQATTSWSCWVSSWVKLCPYVTHDIVEPCKTLRFILCRKGMWHVKAKAYYVWRPQDCSAQMKTWHHQWVETWLPHIHKTCSIQCEPFCSKRAKPEISATILTRVNISQAEVRVATLQECQKHTTRQVDSQHAVVSQTLWVSTMQEGLTWKPAGQVMVQMWRARFHTLNGCQTGTCCWLIWQQCWMMWL